MTTTEGRRWRAINRLFVGRVRMAIGCCDIGSTNRRNQKVASCADRRAMGVCSGSSLVRVEVSLLAC